MPTCELWLQPVVLSLTTPKRIIVKMFALLYAAYRFHAFLPKEWGRGGGGPLFFLLVFKKLVFASLCSFICLQAVYQLSGPED